MEFDQLLQQFFTNNNLEQQKPKNGCFTLFLDGKKVRCFQRNRQAWLEADMGKSESQNSLNRLLLSKNLGIILEQRACLSIKQENHHYCLHQRISLESLTLAMFQKTVENFGGSLRYLSEFIEQSRKSQKA